MEASPALAALATMRAAYDELAGLGLDTLTHPELLAVLGELDGLPRHDHRLDHPATVAIRVGVGGHRRRHPAADVRGDPDGHPRQSLPGDLRQAHRRNSVPYSSSPTA